MKTSSINVVIIENDLSYFLELKSLLEELNCHIISSFDSAEIAIENLPKLPMLPDLVIADIVLKDVLTGIDVAKATQRLNIPFLIQLCQ